jgi:hypothetical protein
MESPGEFQHFYHFLFRDHPDSIIISDITFPPELVEFFNGLCISFQGKNQRLDSPLMMAFIRCPVAIRCQGCHSYR